jgi:hypothetical protein
VDFIVEVVAQGGLRGLFVLFCLYGEDRRMVRIVKRMHAHMSVAGLTDADTESARAREGSRMGITASTRTSSSSGSGGSGSTGSGGSNKSGTRADGRAERRAGNYDRGLEHETGYMVRVVDTAEVFAIAAAAAAAAGVATTDESRAGDRMEKEGENKAEKLYAAQCRAVFEGVRLWEREREKMTVMQEVFEGKDTDYAWWKREWACRKRGKEWERDGDSK